MGPVTAFAGKTLASGQLAAAVADLYVSPALTTAYVKTLYVKNVSAGAVTITLIKRVGGVSFSLPGGALGNGESLVIEDLILGAGESLRGSASAAASCDFIIEGVTEV